ncbi:MAG: hypothetical protein ACRBDI_00195 [Alphaproteobacteria bacterium]
MAIKKNGIIIEKTNYNKNDPQGRMPVLSKILGATPSQTANAAAKKYIANHFNELQDKGFADPQYILFTDATQQFKFAVYDSQKNNEFEIPAMIDEEINIIISSELD